jgi:outer membrane immunogenic protein
MKNSKRITLLIATLLFSAMSSFAASGKKLNPKTDIDSLGGNQELMDMAQNIKSTSRARIVQDRIVDRNLALEVGLLYGGVFGGDPYLRTQTIGAAVDFHITPRWSLGARYFDFGSSLTPEGNRVISTAKKNYASGATANAVDIDTPQNAVLAVVNWYPIYGKTSFLDLGVTQFDLYLIGGGGTMTLDSGSSPMYTAGIGVGAWMSKHISVRTELRWQNYEDKIITGSRKLDSVVGSIGLGWIL